MGVAALNQLLAREGGDLVRPTVRQARGWADFREAGFLALSHLCRRRAGKFTSDFESRQKRGNHVCQSICGRRTGFLLSPTDATEKWYLCSNRSVK